MAQEWAARFYSSKAWQDLRWKRILEENFTCQECHENYMLSPEKLIGHHKVELSPQNITEANIALNSSLIKILCKNCHDKIHKRFGHNRAREVTIVYGPPCSGKNTLVNQLSNRGDIIVDMNRLYQAVSGCALYDKPDNIRFNVFAVRDLLIEQIRTRSGRWQAAWVIGGYSRKLEREALAARLGASLLYCEATEAECKARARAVHGVQYAEWCGYIERWFADFGQAPPG